jgi:amino acid transporter
VRDGFTTAGQPDPTTVLIGAGTDRLGAAWGDAALLLFGTSLFAALISFHNAVARYVFSLGREGILPKGFGRVNPRTGAPWVGSVCQSVLAAGILFIFAITKQDPVLTLFTWLTNLGALGVMLLLATASFAVVAFFRRHPEFGEGAYARQIAPTIAGICLTAIFIVAVLNFNVLITGSTDAPLNSKSVILPAIVIGGGLAGMLLGLWLRSNKPAVYARIGEGGSHD